MSIPNTPRIARFGAILLTLAVMTFTSGIARSAPAVPAAVVVERTAPPASRPVPTQAIEAVERDGYAKREQRASADLAKFQGGSVVIITSTALAIVLGIIIILLIL